MKQVPKNLDLLVHSKVRIVGRSKMVESESRGINCYEFKPGGLHVI